MQVTTTIKEIDLEQVWQLRHEVMWPNMPFDYIKVDNDEDGLHYGLLKDEQLISIVSLFINDREAQFRKFATREDMQGKGYGTTLLTEVLERANQYNVKRIWCNARTDKADFYKKFGLIETEETFIRGGKSYIIMEKVI